MNLDPHLLNFSAGGRLHESGSLHTPASSLPALLDAFAASGGHSLTLYFHGGLVSEPVALEQARALVPEFAENGQSWPIFVIWESGVLETLQSALLEIVHASPLFVEVLRKVLKHAARKLPAQVIAFEAGPGEVPPDPAALLRAQLEAETLPAGDPVALAALDPPPGAPVDAVSDDDARALQEDLAGSAEANRALESILARVRRQPTPEVAGELAPRPASDASTGYLSSDLLAELADAPAPPPGVEAEFFTTAAAWAFAARILRAVVERFRAGTDHGLAATVLEELYRGVYADKVGRFLWDRIKDNAEGAWRPLADGALGEDGAPAQDDVAGGSLFLHLLRGHIQKHGPIELHLVGHSAGAIHICHFVDCAAALFGDDLHIQSISLTAPACTCDLFDRTVVRRERQIDSVSIFTMEDDLERRDPLLAWLPLAYPHSLLYLISGLLEDGGPDAPLLGLARHVSPRRTAGRSGSGDSTATAVGSVRGWLAKDQARLVLARTRENAPAGERSAFTAHYGEKGPMRDRATLDSIAARIRPAPLEKLQPLEVEVTDAIADLLEPSAAVIRAGAAAAAARPREGGLSTDELIAAELGDEPVPAPDAVPISGEQESVLLEAIIGENEIVDHAVLKGLLGAGRAVARIVVSGVQGLYSAHPDQRAALWKQTADANDLLQGYGTGWIFGRARRLLITNNHVIPLREAALTASVEFGYERDIRSGARAQQVLKLTPEDFYLTSPNMAFQGLDYTLVALSRQAPEELGYLEPVQGVTAAKAINIFIVQHPRGDPKAYVLNHNRKVNMTDLYLTYLSDTLEGSSGSPLLDDSLRLVGIHHVGNFRVQIGGREEQTNLGSRIEAVMADIVAQLRAAGGWDDEKVIYWFGEGPVLNLWKAGGRTKSDN